MAFESLSEKFQNIFAGLKKKGKLTEDDVNLAMKEVRFALLEADVNFKVVKAFVSAVRERAIGEEVMKSLTPGQQVIKIVNDEMVKLMEDESSKLTFEADGISVYMLVGLQGAGKTTMAAKLANKLKKAGKKPLLVACDIYRPAAIKQLKVVGEQVDVDVFEMGTSHKPTDIAKAAISHAKARDKNLVIIDTAGRLQIDEDMMNELKDLKELVKPKEILLVVDSMTGQAAVDVASKFNELLSITGIILTKLDGDTRGGAALSTKYITGKPIKVVGVGEKLTDIEDFHADRMTSRILGMGDVLTLIEKAAEAIDHEKAKEMESKIRKAEFTFEDFLDQMNQLKKMGSINDLMAMIPGMGKQLKNVEIDEKEMDRMEAIVLSMTKKERLNPSILNPSRRQRIARGSGNDIAQVNKFIKQFEQSKKMMKQMSGMMRGKGKRGMFNLPFMK